MNQSANEPNEPDRWETDFRQWGQRPQPEQRPFFYTRLQARLNRVGGVGYVAALVAAPTRLCLLGLVRAGTPQRGRGRYRSQRRYPRR